MWCWLPKKQYRYSPLVMRAIDIAWFFRGRNVKWDKFQHWDNLPSYAKVHYLIQAAE